ncbi:MAG TPA: hypothetical protein VES20_23425 [Bryobacteraceae bacterium]|nr:hypothetical protein [Bryobacteraceae bacterium]
MNRGAEEDRASSNDSRGAAHPAGAFDRGAARVRNHEAGGGGLGAQGEDGAPGTLYGSMRRMIDAGLIGESDKRVDPEMDDERRIY